MADFSSEVELAVTPSDQSLRSARREIESELGDVSVDVDTSPSAMVADGGARGGGQRRLVRVQNRQLDVLEDILDELEKSGASGGGGGGLGAGFGLGRLAGGLGGFGAARAAGSTGLATLAGFGIGSLGVEGLEETGGLNAIEGLGSAFDDAFGGGDSILQAIDSIPGAREEIVGITGLAEMAVGDSPERARQADQAFESAGSTSGSGDAFGSLGALLSTQAGRQVIGGGLSTAVQQGGEQPLGETQAFQGVLETLRSEGGPLGEGAATELSSILGDVPADELTSKLSDVPDAVTTFESELNSLAETIKTTTSQIESATTDTLAGQREKEQQLKERSNPRTTPPEGTRERGLRFRNRRGRFGPQPGVPSTESSATSAVEAATSAASEVGESDGTSPTRGEMRVDVQVNNDVTQAFDLSSQRQVEEFLRNPDRYIRDRLRDEVGGGGGR